MKRLKSKHFYLKLKSQNIQFFTINYIFKNRYVPVVMAQASIYWEMKNFAAIEKIFRKSYEFLQEHDAWKLNAGHVLFMQENTKYKKAIDFYEQIVKKSYDNVRLKS